MADFNISKMPNQDAPDGTTTVVGTTGTVSTSKRMLGDAGAGAAGLGSWHRSNGLWKTFALYAADRLAASDIAAAVVEIDACMELPDPATGDIDTDVEFFNIATLNAAGPTFSTEVPWRYVRARVTTPGADPCQVGLHEQGQ